MMSCPDLVSRGDVATTRCFRQRRRRFCTTRPPPSTSPADALLLVRWSTTRTSPFLRFCRTHQATVPQSTISECDPLPTAISSFAWFGSQGVHAFDSLRKVSCESRVVPAISGAFRFPLTMGPAIHRSAGTAWLFCNVTTQGLFSPPGSRAIMAGRVEYRSR